ncbi:DUF5687 family protein [Flammeovirga sp. SubArs3]|uniref:DUF5687 family protein n=1 Tax=Flammeovirga sp. SubArs3 TaxID=2995316 RepID=UPI00248C3A78|nr:DUF5687 family protein [Flammeovirga sp. SubArs3]
MLLKLTYNYFLEKKRQVYDIPSVVTSFFLVLLLLYFSAITVLMGVFIEKIITKEFPDLDVLSVLNKYIFYYVLGDLLVRSILESTTKFNLKPYLYLPIKKSTLLVFLQVRSLFTFFNYFPFLFLISVCFGSGVDKSSLIIWLVVMTLQLFINTSLSYNFGKTIGKRFWSWVLIMAVLSGVLYLDFKQYIFLSDYYQVIVDKVIAMPLLLIIPVIIYCAVFAITHQLLKKKLYLDDETNSTSYSSFDLGNFIQGDSQLWTFIVYESKMILRNKRMRQSLIMSVVFILYPFFTIFDKNSGDVQLFFFSFFPATMIPSTFGQFMFAWEGSYFSFIRTQPFTMKEYVKAKYLMYAGLTTLVVLPLSLIYLAIKPIVTVMICVGYFYSVGVNLLLMMFLATYNEKKVDLDQQNAFNFQGVQAKHMLMVFPILMGVLIIFGGFYYLISLKAALISIVVIGVLGMLVHRPLINLVTDNLIEKRYKMTEGFKNS